MMTFLILVFLIGSFVTGMGVGIKLQQHAIKKALEQSK